MENKASGYWVSSLEKIRDPIRTCYWKVKFNFNELGTGFGKSEELTLTIKDVDFPGVKTVTDSIFFYGLEKKLPTSADNSGTISMTIQETEDMVGYSNLLQWHQRCMNGAAYSIKEIGKEDMLFTTDHFIGDISLNNTTLENGSNIRYVGNKNIVTIEMYEYSSGEILLESKFLNIYPIEIGAVKLAQDSKELYKYSVTMSYDIAKIITKRKKEFKSFKNPG